MENKKKIIIINYFNLCIGIVLIFTCLHIYILICNLISIYISLRKDYKWKFHSKHYAIWVHFYQNFHYFVNFVYYII